MRTLRPLEGDDPRLRGLGDGLRWWRLDCDGRPAAGEMPRCLAGTTGWSARVHGSDEARAYAAAIVGRPQRPGPSLRLDDLDGEAAATLLDAAPGSSLTVALERTGHEGVAAVFADGSEMWAALAGPNSVDAARLARDLGATLLDAPSVPLPLRAVSPPRPRTIRLPRGRGPRVLAGALAGLVAAASTGAVLWRHTHGAPTAPVAAQPSAVGAGAAPPPAPRPRLPEATFGSTIVYDPPRDEVLMVGGVGGYDETWAWRPAFHWVAQQPGIAPAGRFGAAAAYDSRTRTVVVYGGREQQGRPLNDTWTWDGGWSTIGSASRTAGAAPPGGEFPVMGYDPVRDQVVLVVRVVDAPAETWVLQPDGTWAAQAGAGELPAPLAMAWDGAGRQLLLVTAGSRSDRSRTWAWSGARWTPLGDMTVSVNTASGGMATDPQTGHAVLVASDGGAGDGSSPVWRTWVWDGRSWHDAAPPPEAVAGLASDVVDGELLAFTQSGGDTTLPVRDAWAWSGTVWIQLY